ncbi:MAG: D-alanine--D-alanine ligase [Anaerolineae bacterium]|nr:D-alanine--D-alanine ligase [Anaerolineae bacterium]
MSEGQPGRLRVGVLFGGRSAEHDVSLASARAVIDNLQGDDIEVIPIGITREGRWIAGGDTWQALASGPQPSALNPATPEVEAVTMTPDPTQSGKLLRLEASSRITRHASSTTHHPPLRDLDVIFPVLHGTYGEDGTVQGLLELADVPYVGCGVLASSVGMDKAVMKAVFRAAGLPVLPYVTLLRRDWQTDPDAAIGQVEAALRYPVFVKPANLGSSVGISKVQRREELAPALDLAADYDRKIVVEQGIPAREIEVSVLGNDEVEASAPGEVVPSNEWYDYAAKYLDGESAILIPAPIPAETAATVQRLAVKAFRAVDGSGLSRVDFLLDRETGELWLNEVNTMPGFTPISMYAKMWAASGVGYGELCRRLVHLALERHADRQQNRTTR